MQINSIAAPATSSVLARTATALNRQNLLEGTGMLGPLTPGDHKLLQAASGLTFSWPPGKDELFPEEAVNLSALRAQQLAADLPIKELNRSDLAKMLTAGTISQDFADHALAYLRTGTPAPEKTVASIRAAQLASDAIYL